jgi:hypothetical protein
MEGDYNEISACVDIPIYHEACIDSESVIQSKVCL